MRHGHRWLIGALVVVGMVVALTLIASGGQGSLAEDGIIYVDADAPGPGDGEDWTTAYTDLQDALAAAEAEAPVQIWVAEGTYKPTSGTDRTISFQMKNGVAIYGGFAGTETELGQRDWEAHPTILSGDIGIEGDSSDNSYHVFYHPSGTPLDSSAILDGFTITGGNANEEWGTDALGGGMSNESSSPTLANCTFSGNSAGIAGGMMNYENSAPALTNCTFEDNSAGFAGGMQNYMSSPVLADCTFRSNSAEGPVGGMSNMDSSPILTNCTFSGNSSGAWGGGMSNSQNSAPTLTNCTFYGNSANSWGGGISNGGSSPVVTNCILWGDTPQEIYNTDETSLPVVTYSDVQGGYEGGGNINVNPFFVDAANGDLHLRACSRCIDAGNNEAPDLPLYDFEGDDRMIDGDGNGTATVDMGVDEAVDGLPCMQIYLPLVLRGY